MEERRWNELFCTYLPVVEESNVESPYLNLHMIIWVDATLLTTIESCESCQKKIISGNS